MFFEDALTASRELDLTLTGKQCGLPERAPMCGVPFHSYESYVARLIAKGYKVAICEQVEDPSKAKGLVKRDIIRVLTPGTVSESSMLQDDKNNYIASIYLKGKRAGLCFADISTGTAHVTELSGERISNAILTELCRYHPSEVLMNTAVLDCRDLTAYIEKAAPLRCRAGRGWALFSRPYRDRAGRSIWTGLGTVHHHRQRWSGAVCHGSAAGISARNTESKA